MPTKTKDTRTTMYSVEAITKRGVERQEVVTHHLPWPKGSEKLEQFKRRGFTFERPEINDRVEMPLISKRDAPGVVLMPPIQKDWAHMNAEERAAYKAGKQKG